MDPELRRAWTKIVTAADYDAHMSAIGQSRAAAELTRYLIDRAGLGPGSRIVIAGAGTGQLFEFPEAAIFRAHRLTCADINRDFLARLGERLRKQSLAAELVEDDIEQTALAPGCDLLLATLLLEHIDWRRGVESFAGLQPRFCGVILQENPPGMSAAVTPGRPLPASIAKAVETAHPALVPREELITAMAAAGFECSQTAARDVADGKKLAGLLFRALKR